MKYLSLHIMLVAAILCASGAIVRAAALEWDTSTDPGVQDTDGFWDTSTANWTPDDGGTNVLWNNSNQDTANFNVIGPYNDFTVTLGADVKASRINRGGATSAYLVTIDPDAGGLYSITLDPDSPIGPETVTINASGTRPLHIHAPIIMAGDDQRFRGTLVIGGVVSETGDSYSLLLDTGDVTLSKANTFSGGLNVRGATARLGDNDAPGSGVFTINKGAEIIAEGGDRTFDNVVDGFGVAGGGSSIRAFSGTNRMHFTDTTPINLRTTPIFEVNAPRVTFDAPLTNVVHYIDSAFTKTGTGELVLNGDNSYSGVTDVDAGTLLINGSTGDLTNSGVVPQLSGYNVAGGATLGGTGTINLDSSVSVDVASGGAIAPAGMGAIGTFTVNGDVNLDGTLAIEIDGLLNDVFDVNGLLSLGSTAELALSMLSPIDPFATYSFLQYDTLSGGFAVDNIPSSHELDMTVAGEMRLVPTQQPGGATAIPEPAGMMLLLCGGTALLRRRRR